jgi:aspartate 1-decarboxylase
MHRIQVVRAKLHGLTVTDANLNYQGSITLDPLHCEAVGIYPLEFVDIWNRNSGARLSTYVIFGEPGSRCCILNGAAARTCQPGDKVIVAASAFIEPPALYDLDPKVLVFDGDNRDRARASLSGPPDGPAGFRLPHRRRAGRRTSRAR